MKPEKTDTKRAPGAHKDTIVVAGNGTIKGNGAWNLFYIYFNYRQTEVDGNMPL